MLMTEQLQSIMPRLSEAIRRACPRAPAPHETAREEAKGNETDSEAV